MRTGLNPENKQQSMCSEILEILDLTAVIKPYIEHRNIGMRPGEKLDEIMITRNEAPYTVRRGRYYIICPTQENWSRDQYCNQTMAEKVEDGFEYDSGTNKDWLSVEQIKKLIDNENII